jgi:hypothetical protein
MRRVVFPAATVILLAGCMPLHVTTASGFGFRTWSNSSSSYDSVSQLVSGPGCARDYSSWRLRIPVEELQRIEILANSLNVWEGREVTQPDCRQTEPDLGGAIEFFDQSRKVRLDWRQCRSPGPRYHDLLERIDRLLERTRKDDEKGYGCVFL